MVEPGLIRDQETCLITGSTRSFVPGPYVGHPTVVVPPFGLSQWASDLDGRLSTTSISRFVDNGHGSLTDIIIAFYS